MNEPKFYNLHNVYVKTGLATKEQLESSISSFKTQLERMLPGKNYGKCEILTNLVTIRGDSAKYAFLWVENPEVYYIMCGFNPDGTQRYEDFIEETKSEESDDDLEDDLSCLDISNIMKEKEKKMVIKIKKPLEPILTLPGYEYTPEQSKLAHSELVTEEERLAVLESREVATIEPLKFGYFECTRSHTPSINPELSCTTLWGRVPMWVDQANISSIFKRYVESTDSKGFVITFGNECRDMKGFKDVTICFGNRRGVATFALQMTRKTTFKDPKTGQTSDCIFNFYRSKDASHGTSNKEDNSRDKKHNNNYSKNNAGSGFRGINSNFNRF
jgi:hypothetical protein